MPGREDYERFFKEADTDDSGTLTLDELVIALRKSGYTGTDEKLKSMFNKADTSGDKLLTLEEFLIAMGEQPEETHTNAYMRHIFQTFDKNDDGTIDQEELKEVYNQMRKVLSESEVSRIINLMDANKDGVINYQEFLDFYCPGEKSDA